MKDDGLLERNHLLGAEGKAINPTRCAAGHIPRLLASWLAISTALLIAAIRRHRLAQRSSGAAAFAT
jgi:IS5 family transposase